MQPLNLAFVTYEPLWAQSFLEHTQRFATQINLTPIVIEGEEELPRNWPC